MNISDEATRTKIQLAIKAKLDLYATEKDQRTFAYAMRTDYYNGLIKPVVNPGHEQITTRLCAAIADISSAYAGTNCFGINITAKDFTNESDIVLAQSAEDISNDILDSSDKEAWFLTASETNSRLGDGPVTTEMKEGLPYHEAILKPENVYFGWRTDNANEMEWWAYEYGITPEAALDRFKDRIPATSDLNQDYNQSSDRTTLAGVYDLIRSVVLQPRDKSPKWVKITLFNTFVALTDESGNIVVPANSQVVLANNVAYEILEGKAKELYNFVANTAPGLSTGVCDFETSVDPITEFEKKLGEQSDASSQAVNQTYVTDDSNIERLKQKLTPNKSQIIKKQTKETVFEVLKKNGNAYDAEPLNKNLLAIIRTNSGLQELLQDQISPNISGKALAYVYQGVVQKVTKKRIRWTPLIKKMVINDLWLFTEDKPDMRKAFFDGNKFKFKVNVTWPDVLDSDKATKIANVLNLKNAKIISGYSAMQQVDVTDPTMEQKRIDQEMQKDLEFQQALQGELAQPSEGPVMNESMNQEGEGIAAQPGAAGSSQMAGMSSKGAMNQQMQNGGK